MKIIINADDFGESREVNKAIYNSAKNKYITSSTIMAVASQLDEAVEMSKELTHISFGIHLVFDDDFKSLSGNPVSFQKNDIIKINRFNIFKLDILVKEFSLQIEKLLQKGVKISHIDTHHHIHKFPLVVLAIMKVAKKYDIKKIRSQKIISNDITMPFFNNLYRTLHHNVVKKKGFVQPDYYMDFPILLDDNIKKYDNTVYEIMCHPGSEYNDEQYFNEEVYADFQGKLITYNDLK
jgi:predicted glycoside hydrolase/deacetylase ChbG (UPF0249 family)